MKILYLSLLSVILLTWIGHLILIPPWQNPDEPLHFDYIKTFMNQETFSLDIQPDLLTQREIIRSMDRHRYWKYVQVSPPDPLPGSFKETPFLNTTNISDFGHLKSTPPLYYVLVASLLSPVSEKSLEVQLYLARVFSIGLGLLTLFLSYLIVKELFQDQPEWALAVLAFIGLLPQFNLVTTSVNPDNLANLLTTGVIYLQILMLKGGPTPAKLTLATLGILAGLMTKRTTFMMVPLAGLSLLFLSWNYLKGKRFSIWLITFYKAANVFLLLLGVYALLTWYFPETVRFLVAKIAVVLYQGPLLLFKFLSQPSVSRIREVGQILFESFWYTFGWMLYHLSESWYLGLQVMCALALLGLILFWFRAIQRKIHMKTWQVQGLILLIFSCLLVILGVFLTSRGFNLLMQGRYLFPALSAFAILGTLGLYQLVPKKLYSLFTVIFILGLLAFNGVTLWGYTIPGFYDFPLRVISHQPIADQPIGEIFGDKKVGQTFLAESDGLTGIDLFLATYARTNSYSVIFHLKEKPNSITDLATSTFSAQKVRDNAYYRFQFPIISDSQGKSYYFYLESPESHPGNAITSWYHSEDSYKNGSLFINEKEEKGDLTFRTVYKSSLKNFMEGLAGNKPFPLNSSILYLSLLSFYGLSVLFLMISTLKSFLTF